VWIVVPRTKQSPCFLSFCDGSRNDLQKPLALQLYPKNSRAFVGLKDQMRFPKCVEQDAVGGIDVTETVVAMAAHGDRPAALDVEGVRARLSRAPGRGRGSARIAELECPGIGRLCWTPRPQADESAYGELHRKLPNDLPFSGEAL
jgi:hypothetical protein